MAATTPEWSTGILNLMRSFAASDIKDEDKQWTFFVKRLLPVNGDWLDLQGAPDGISYDPKAHIENLVDVKTLTEDITNHALKDRVQLSGIFSLDFKLGSFIINFSHRLDFHNSLESAHGLWRPGCHVRDAQLPRAAAGPLALP
jgi:hypothetical protein